MNKGQVKDLSKLIEEFAAAIRSSIEEGRLRCPICNAPLRTEGNFEAVYCVRGDYYMDLGE